MKRIRNTFLIIVISYITLFMLFSCTKEDQLIVTNPHPKEVSVIINHEKKLEIIQPGQSVVYFISGLNNVQLIQNNIVINQDDVLVNGTTYYP